MGRKIITILLILILIFIFWIIWTNINITTTYFQIKSKKIQPDFDEFKIAHISDLHNRQWDDNLISKIKDEKPNIIAITGDLVDSRKTDFGIALEFIQEASNIAPIYYVTGNHEARLADEYNILKEELENLGVTMMDNQYYFVEKGNEKLQIIGIQDPDFVERTGNTNIQGDIIRVKLNELINKNYYSIVLSHRPEHFEQYVNTGADLILTGHAHGGQVRIPFVGGIIAPNQGIFPKYSEGIHNIKNTNMIVSRGLGNSVIPIRINNIPELVIITLNAG